jgi:GT2 family glycosyltransferase
VSKTLPISVVIPSYNSEAFVAAAIASAQGQTAAPAEIIVVDDGSTDRTADVANEAGARVITQPNSGPASARNRGIQAASQPWIALLDADDLWEPRKLELQWSAVSISTGVGIVSTDHCQFSSAGIEVDSFLSMRGYYQGAKRSVVAEGISELASAVDTLTEIGMFLFPSTVLLSRDLALRSGLFDPELRRVEDSEFFLRVLRHTKLAVVESVLVRYRIHGESSSDDHQAMSEAVLGVAERIIRNPSLYAEGAVHYALQREAEQLDYRARREIARGDLRAAQATLRRALMRRWRARSVVLLLVTLLGNRAILGLQRLRRSLKQLSLYR